MAFGKCIPGKHDKRVANGASIKDFSRSSYSNKEGKLKLDRRNFLNIVGLLKIILE